MNKVRSDATQLPYAYYDLPFVCQPSKDAERVGLNLGEVIGGDRIRGSDFKLEMRVKKECETLCEKKVTKKDLKRAKELIEKDYRVEWIVDNLPGATTLISPDKTSRYYLTGFKLGDVDQKTGKVYLNNHFFLVIRYREAHPGSDDSRNLIVGFEIYPQSVSLDSKACPSQKTDDFNFQVIDDTKDEDTIRYTYSVHWMPDNNAEWANRWDMYLKESENTEKRSKLFHWFSLANSLVIATVLALMVAIVLIRTLHKDIQDYRAKQGSSMELGDMSEEPDKNKAGTEDDSSGWKLVHGDVFRAPPNPSLFTALLGSGLQFLVMSVTVIAFSCLGFLNPSYRGGLVSYALFLFAFSGIFAGYVNARMNTDLQKEKWTGTVILTATLVPAIIMTVVLTLNMFVWAKASSSALPFGTIMALFAIWLLISCPLVVIGSFIGRRVKGSTFPTRINIIPRQIPRGRVTVRSTFLAVLLGGILPFVVIAVELISIYKSLWQTKSTYYYMYGFFVLIFSVLIITVMEMSILSTYFMLNSEDYRWWWRSFFVGAGSGIWIFIFSIFYYFTNLNVGGFVSTLLFFGYSLIGCCVYSLVTGTIGFFASYLFVQNIYRAIKAD